MPVNPRIVLALRNRAKARRKRTPGRMAPPAYPRGAELRYTRALRAYVRSLAAAVREHVYPVLDRDNDGVANALPIGDLGRAWVAVRSAVVGPEADARAAARRFVGEANATNRDSMNARYRALIGVSPFADIGLKSPYADAPTRRDAQTGVEGVLRARLRDNVNLITTIAPTALGQVEDVIQEGFRSGLRVEELAKSIAERFSVAESRAELIARDQTGKLNAQLSEARNREVGATRYVWQISGAPEGDGRVREEHLELQGQTFSYDDPPVVAKNGDRANPGEYFQCRCSAQPVLEDVLAALGI